MTRHLSVELEKKVQPVQREATFDCWARIETITIIKANSGAKNHQR